MKNIKRSLQSLLLLPVLALGASAALPVLGAAPVGAQAAANCQNDPTTGLAGGASCSKTEEQGADLFGPDGIFKTITNVLLFIIGAISVIMLIIGGIRYTISNGDASAVTSAKNTILYAVIGIIVAILSYALVNFVITSFTGNGS